MRFLLLGLASAFASPTTVLLVRHAEKGAGDNPSLTDAGRARAAALATTVRSLELTAVYSTDLCRTAQTVDAAAASRGLPLQLLPVAKADLSRCQPGLRQPTVLLPEGDDLAARIRALPAGSQVLVAGHSNTIPALIASLGAASLCPEPFPLDEDGNCWLPHDAYDNLFIVTLPEAGSPSTVHLHFGVPTEQVHHGDQEK